MAGTPEIEEKALERGRRLFAGPVRFVKGVVSVDDLPAPDLPEIAFAGRSNVGKSSLINALTGRKNLARASNTPGRTREINFFALGPEKAPVLHLVDLPGYGYARASKAEVRRWTGLVRDYLQGRAVLHRVFLLIDARHGPKESDLEVMTMLDRAAVSYQVVLTKADKPKSADLEKVIEETGKAIARRPAAHPRLIVTSAEKGTGLDLLRGEAAAVAARQPMGYKAAT